MTTTIKVTSHNYPARVETLDNGKVSHTEIITPIDGERTFHCTTTRELRITDLEYNDPTFLPIRPRKPQQRRHNPPHHNTG